MGLKGKSSPKSKGLTSSELAKFHLKGIICPKSLQLLHNLPVNWARELFKPLKDSASLLVCNGKKFFRLQIGWYRKWDRIRLLWLRLLGTGHKPLDRSISLQFLVKTRLKSKPIEPLIDFLVFLLHKLRPKKHKIGISQKVVILPWLLNQKCYKASQRFKDLDFSLVSSENFSEIPPSGWVQGLATWSKTAKNLSHFTRWELVHDIFIPGNRPKTSSFRLPYQCHSSYADCARELFKGSNGSTRLLACNEKTFFGRGLRIFVSDVISEVVFGPFLLMLPDLGPYI